MNFKILRARHEDGNFGMMVGPDGMPFAVTAELPWHDNLPFVSCVPDGVYLCKRVDSPRFGNTFEITGVPNRSSILFHKGNVPTRDLKGCVAIGEKFEDVGGENAIQDSKHGYEEFMKMLNGRDGFTVEIRTVTGD